MKINAVEFMYEELCYKSSTSKYENSNSNINISNISHLPFDMLCFLLEKMMTQCSMHWQSAGTIKQFMVKNSVNGMTK